MFYVNCKLEEDPTDISRKRYDTVGDAYAAAQDGEILYKVKYKVKPVKYFGEVDE